MQIVEVTELLKWRRKLRAKIESGTYETEAIKNMYLNSVDKEIKQLEEELVVLKEMEEQGKI